jgi:hypothetical protein
LQATYIKAYVEITRLVAEYEALINGHNCQDWVYHEEEYREKALKEKQTVLITTVTTFEQKLVAYKVRIREAYQAEWKLRVHIEELTMRCKSMDATVSSLDKVRDAIHIIGACPGLGAIEFKIPTWTGFWKEAYFDTIGKTSDMIDAEMNQLCASNPFSDSDMSMMETSPPTILTLPKKYRAAETSEIMLKAIDGMPQTNTAGLPIIGTCPNCQGDPDEADGPQHASGHARVCWQPDSVLVMQYRSTDCTAGRKAVVCVEEIQLPTANKSTAGIPLGCQLWYDGCHTCVVSNGQLGGCSVGTCITPGVQPHCKHITATIPPGCSVWYDGCKQCSVDANGFVQLCPDQACPSVGQAECLEFGWTAPPTPFPTQLPTPFPTPLASNPDA